MNQFTHIGGEMKLGFMSELIVPAGAIQEDEIMNIKYCSIVDCPNWDTSPIVDERLILPPIEIWESDNKKFKKHICIKLKHNVRETQSIKVYWAPDSLSTSFTEISRQKSCDAYFEVDDSHICIYTTHFSTYICSSTTCPNEVYAPTDINISIYSQYIEYQSIIEVYLFDEQTLPPAYAKVSVSSNYHYKAVLWRSIVMGFACLTAALFIEEILSKLGGIP